MFGLTLPRVCFCFLSDQKIRCRSCSWLKLLNTLYLHFIHWSAARPWFVFVTLQSRTKLLTSCAARDDSWAHTALRQIVLHSMSAVQPCDLFAVTWSRGAPDSLLTMHPHTIHFYRANLTWLLTQFCDTFLKKHCVNVVMFSNAELSLRNHRLPPCVCSPSTPRSCCVSSSFWRSTWKGPAPAAASRPRLAPACCPWWWTRCPRARWPTCWWCRWASRTTASSRETTTASSWWAFRRVALSGILQPPEEAGAASCGWVGGWSTLTAVAVFSHQGKPKKNESLWGIACGVFRMLRKNYGCVRVDFNQPFSLKVDKCSLTAFTLASLLLLSAPPLMLQCVQFGFVVKAAWKYINQSVYKQCSKCNLFFLQMSLIFTYFRILLGSQTDSWTNTKRAVRPAFIQILHTELSHKQFIFIFFIEVSTAHIHITYYFSPQPKCINE